MNERTKSFHNIYDFDYWSEYYFNYTLAENNTFNLDMQYAALFGQ